MNEDRRRFRTYPIVSPYNDNAYSFIIEVSRYRSQSRYEDDFRDVHAKTQGAEYNIRTYGVAGYVHKHS